MISIRRACLVLLADCDVRELLWRLILATDEACVGARAATYDADLGGLLRRLIEEKVTTVAAVGKLRAVCRVIVARMHLADKIALGLEADEMMTIAQILMDGSNSDN